MLMWNVTGSREVYVNTWIRVVEDQVVRPDGAPGVYGVVEMRRPSVFVVALTDDDEVLFVTVDRHTTGESVELPAGGTDGDDPLAAARRLPERDLARGPANLARCLGLTGADSGLTSPTPSGL